MKYGRAIKIVRAAREVSQAELADAISIGASHLSLIEAGKRQPSLRVLQEIAGALRVPPHLLTLLASEPADLERPENAAQVDQLAKVLLRVLLVSENQPPLPFKVKKPA